MRNVIVINEECHGFLGVAKDMKNAFQFLLKEKWITEKTDFPIDADDDSDFVPLETLMKRFEFDNLLDTLMFLWSDSEMWFEAMFYFEKETVIDYD